MVDRKITGLEVAGSSPVTITFYHISPYIITIDKSMSPLPENERQAHQNAGKPFQVQLSRCVLWGIRFAAIQKDVFPLDFSFGQLWSCLEVVHVVNLLREISSEHIVALFSLEMSQDGVSDVHHQQGLDVAVPIVIRSEHPFVALIDYILREIEELFVDGIAEMIFGDNRKIPFLVMLFLLLENTRPGLINILDALLPDKVLIQSQVAQCSIAEELHQAFPCQDDVLEDEDWQCVTHEFFAFEVLDHD